VGDDHAGIVPGEVIPHAHHTAAGRGAGEGHPAMACALDRASTGTGLAATAQVG